jgi:serine/threonine protein kinase
MEIKVSDFGLAVQLENSDEKAMIICGTPTYMAPEVIRGDVGYSF